MNSFMKVVFTSIIAVALSFVASTQAHAQSSVYPSIRYLSPYSQSMGGVSLPLTNDTGNNLFNNPAGLARNEKFKSEFLNLTLDAGSHALADIGPNMTSLGGLSKSLNANPNTTYAEGFSNLTAVSWGGLGVGLLFQERVRAYSDGTTAYYQATKDIIPAVGYGLALARGVVRLGYSFQYVNEASGTSQSPSDSSAGFFKGIPQKNGFSSNASVNFAFPFTYLPTLSLLGRNIGGGLQSFDSAFDFTVRLSGALKSHWFLEYDDFTGSVSMPFLERVRLGLEIGFSQAFAVRMGGNGAEYSAGVGFKSESSEINLTYYHDRSPFASNEYWDARFALQYKVFFQGHSTRDRESEAKGK